MNETLSPPKDLTDPAVLLSECEAIASGLQLELQTKTGHSAMGGVPDPAFFFARAHALVTAVQERLRADLARAKAEPEPRKIKTPKEPS